MARATCDVEEAFRNITREVCRRFWGEAHGSQLEPWLRVTAPVGQALVEAPEWVSPLLSLFPVCPLLPTAWHLPVTRDWFVLLLTSGP